MTNTVWSRTGVCVSDLAVFGLQHLFDSGLLKRDEIDALISGDAIAGSFHAANQQHHPRPSRFETGCVLPGHQPVPARVLSSA